MSKRQNTVILEDLFSSKFHLEVSCMKQEPWKPIAKIKTIFTSYYNINATFSKTESNMLAREVVFQHNVKKLHVCTRTFQNCFCNMHNNNCKFLQLTFFFKKVFILSRSLYVSCGRTICQAARGGWFLQLWGPCHPRTAAAAPARRCRPRPAAAGPAAGAGACAAAPRHRGAAH